MHNAPSVTYPVGRSRNAIRLVLGLWILGTCGVCAWCMGQWPFNADAVWKPAALVFALMLAAWGAWRSVRLTQGAELNWDGEHWSVAGSALGTALATVHLDLQFLLLVRVVESGRPAKWLWLDRATMPERWLDLRRALHARVATPDASQSSKAAKRAGRMDSASVP